MFTNLKTMVKDTNMKKQVGSIFKNATVVSLLSAVIFVAVFCSFAFLPTSVCEANSALRYYEGRDSAGVVLTTKDSPVVVEKEDLTFDIRFDDDFSGLQVGAVSAKYTFKNSSDTEAKTNVVFPIDFLSDINYQNNDDFSKYGVKVNDKDVESKLRYSYRSLGSEFSVEDDLKYLKDEIVTDEFYTPDAVVYKYIYASTASDAFCKLYLDDLDARKIVVESGYTDFTQNLDGKTSIGFWVRDNENIFYSIGEEIDFAQRAQFFSSYSSSDRVSGSFKLLSKQQMTFKDLVYQYYAEGYGVSETDWYNAVYASLKDVYPKIASGYRFNIYNNLYCWFEYDMTFKPHETLVNEVVAPLYPDINVMYSPSVYVFNYLVSPASTWKSFADLNVTINTNYYLTDASEDFEQTEGGYTWHSDTLPSNELQFSLCKSANPQSSSENVWNTISSIILLTVLEPLCIIIVGLVIVIVVIKKKGKNAKYGEPRSKQKRTDKNQNISDCHSNDSAQCSDVLNESQNAADSPSSDNSQNGDVLNENSQTESEPKNIDLSKDEEEKGANDDMSK